MIRIYNRDRALSDAIKRLNELERRTGGPDAIDGPDLVEVITRIAERAAGSPGERAVERAERAVERAERAAAAAEEFDADAIWTKIEERVAEAAAEAARDVIRDVIRDELVAHFDLI